MNKTQWFKLEIFVPASHLKVVKATLQEVDAGHIGNYDSCLAYSTVKSTWRPLDGAKPYIGTPGTVSEEEEIKVEVNVKCDRLNETVATIRRIHPYEEPIINVIPLHTV
ncbi:MAG: cytochrome C biogenesis protein [Selenomonas sp.]|nr:cytochrome C biogenesis protein [Selenomonas sp.]